MCGHHVIFRSMLNIMILSKPLKGPAARGAGKGHTKNTKELKWGRYFTSEQNTQRE